MTESQLPQPLFVPLDFVVPQVLQTPHFRLRMLAVSDVENDYAAVMESADLLHRMFGRAWPTADFTLAENLQDLVEHQGEFERREAFAYTVMNPDETVCLGCVYINPPRGQPVDARVRMWVRQSAHDQGLDPILFHTVKTWLAAQWPFTNVLYPGRTEDGTWQPLNGALVS